MNKIKVIALSFAVVCSVAAGGYWLGRQSQDVGLGMRDVGDRKQDSGGQPSARKLLYYRNPMGLPDTSPVPKQDAMGMAYVPVYEDEAGGIALSADKMQKLGVTRVAATRQRLQQTLQLAGRIEVDERRVHRVAPKFEGWVERLHVNQTGQMVRRGEPLFEVYSPELLSTQREYELARQAAATDAGMTSLANASLARLQHWNVSPGEKHSLNAPVSGVVLEKKAVPGMRFMPGDSLYQIADLSSVWVVAEIAEQDAGQVVVGQHAEITLTAYPGRHFDGKLSFVSPTLNPATRTVAVRIELANPDGLLKPAQFARVTLMTGSEARRLCVPLSAVIDSGQRQVALVQTAPGHFEPRELKLGIRNTDQVEVLAGLKEGEQVVSSALFLIDAESNLKAALQGLNGGAKNGANIEAGKRDAGHSEPGRSEVPGTEPPKTLSPRASRQQPAETVGHQGQGVLEAINADGTVSITHQAIKSLGWPGMTMDFVLANPALAAGIAPGSAIRFEIVERKPDEWVITRLNKEH